MPITWTKKTPTKPGWYWFRGDMHAWTYHDPIIVRLESPYHGLEVHMAGSDVTVELPALNGEWYGPLQAPKREG